MRSMGNKLSDDNFLRAQDTQLNKVYDKPRCTKFVDDQQIQH